jgi:hypothetical protein
MDDSDSEKLRDYRTNPEYERRVVIFYDVLGWKNHIERADTDPEAIGKLRRLILQHSRTLQLRTFLNIRVSTFSDNIVISQPPGENTQRLIQQMSLLELGSATEGYHLRGGVTIGDLIHDDECVFGPGLNRAYELESKIARYPRFVLDPNHIAEFGNLGDLPITEGGVTFLNTFTLAFCEHVRRKGKSASSPEELQDAGLPVPKSWHRDVTARTMLEFVLDPLKPQIRGPMVDKDFEKLAWIYDRIAKQLGVPPSSSYPRVKPELSE